MNPDTPQNWTLSSYTNSAWTDIVAEEAVIANLSIANTSSSNINISVRLSDGTNNLSIIVPTTTISAGDAFRVDLRAVFVSSTQSIQVWADSSGIEYMASGAIDGSA